MDRAKIDAINPVLPVKDVKTSVEYYVSRLGFAFAFADSHEDPKYAGVVRDNVEIHLQWHDLSEWDRVERPSLRFVVPEVELLFEEYKTKNVFHEGTSLHETPWGTREFAFFDLDNNGLTFYCDL